MAWRAGATARLFFERPPLFDKPVGSSDLFGFHLGLDLAAQFQGADAVDAAHARKRKRQPQIGFYVIPQARNVTSVQVAQHDARIAVAFTGGVAHEFNNLLTGIGGFAQMARRKSDDVEAVQGYLAEIEKATDHAAGLTRQMLTFSRTQVLEPRLVPVGSTIDGIRSMLKPLVGAVITLRMELCAGECHAVVDPGQLVQAILNLAINACHAMEDGGELLIGCGEVGLSDRLRARFGRPYEGPCVAASVADTGSGIADDVLPQIFDPFFTTKASGSGTGLGLSMVYGMAEQAGGFVDVETRAGEGTRFTIYLPLADQDAALDVTNATPEAGSRGVALIVDGKAGVRRIAGESLEANGYEIVAVETADEARDAFRSRDGAVELLIVDVAMGGAEIAGAFRAENQFLKVVFLATDPVAGAECRADSPDHSRFLQKPIDRQELRRLVSELVEGVDGVST